METNKYVFEHPCRCLIAGPSGSGKSEFIKKVIRHRARLFSVTPQRIIYTYKYPQAWMVDFPNVEFTTEVPTILDPALPSMVVLDDIVCDANALNECVSLFVRGSHHMNASVFFLTQNLFAGSSQYRTISLNSTQFVLFKTIRGLHQIETLGRQIFGKKSEFMKVYKDATESPYSYLLIDLSPTQTYRLRARVLPGEEYEIVYLLQ